MTTVITEPSIIFPTLPLNVDELEERSGMLFAQVDSEGVVPDADSGNNIFTDGVEVCFASQDAYEPNNNSDEALLIEVGHSSTHNNHNMEDQDWYVFEATAGTAYVLHTSELGSAADTYLYLFDVDGDTLLSSNDDFDGSLASRIEWVAPADGIYYAMVKHWNPSAGGCGTGYTFELKYGPQTIHVPLDYQTISQALSVAQPGDTVLVSAGTYAEAPLVISNGIHLIGEGAEHTIIQGLSTGTVIYVGGDVTVSGFTIIGSGNNWWDAGIWIDDGNSVISHNIITGNSMGIVFYCWSPCSSQPKIENNLIHHNLVDGILAHDGAPTILNNTVVSNNHSGIVVNRDGTVVMNNVIANQQNIGIAGGSAAILNDYNNVWNNLGSNYIDILPGAQDVSSDPRFVSPETHDYRLQVASPNIDTGIENAGLEEDLDGNPRPYDGNGDGLALYDIGAYEFISSPNLPPNAPSDLTATGVSANQIDLAWVDNSTDETAFEIERSLDAVEWSHHVTVDMNITAYTDTDLSNNTIYYYQVRAVNDAGHSPYTNVAVATTAGLPLAPSNLSAQAVSSTEIHLTWQDNSNDEDGFNIERSPDGVSDWTLITIVDANTTEFSDSSLEPNTTYYYQVTAFNTVGTSPYSNIAFALTSDQEVDYLYVATGQVPVAGTVSGNYTDTYSDDGVYQTIAERESGGQPARRYSYLEHKWVFEIDAGIPATFYANVFASVSDDNDTFIFAYSEDDVNYTEMFTVISNTDNNTYLSYLLPGTQTGQIYIRVMDSDRTPGNRSLDTVYIDLLSIHSQTQTGTPPEAPTDLSATAVSATEILLAWSDNSLNEMGFRLERSMDGNNWDVISTLPADSTSHLDTNLSEETTYYYRIYAYNSSGNSDYSDVADSTTLMVEIKYIHVGDLDGSAVLNKNKWNATVTILIHDQDELPVIGAVVTGTWNNGATGYGTCTTGAYGLCTVNQNNLRTSVASVRFTIDHVSDGASIYVPTENHDPDGDSDGTSIIVFRPQ
jgi:parallel beta-helix repeat protein